jgi:hypothetical protein
LVAGAVFLAAGLRAAVFLAVVVAISIIPFGG